MPLQLAMGGLKAKEFRRAVTQKVVDFDRKSLYNYTIVTNVTRREHM